VSEPVPKVPQRPARPLVPSLAPPRLDLARIMEGAGETAFLWDLVRDTIQWDSHAARLLGVRRMDDIASGPGYMLCLQGADAELRRRVLARDKPIATGGSAGSPYRLQYSFHPDGRSRPRAIYLEEEGRLLVGADGRPAAASGVIRVVTERFEAEQRLRYRGEHDELTGQLNRTTLMEQLAATIQRSQVARSPCAFLVAAVNGLDVVNHTFGFEVGDEVLSGVARLVKRHLREGDHLGRYASNKFGIVLNDCGPGVMRIVADRIMASVRSNHIQTSSSKLAATVSLGGISLADGALTGEQAAACALQSLDRARLKRLDSFVAYEARPEEQNIRRRNTALANALISALDEHRMVLELQPMVSAKSGKTEHYECLLRMVNLDGSRVSAGDFMPIAEQLGLSRLIDLRSQELVIGLLNAYPLVNLSLNVSGLTSSDNDWLVSLHRLTGGNRRITERLTIEITETAAIHDLDQTMVFVDTIKDLGCKAAIDDFGVGYTNFRNLKLLKADLLKIDGTFVKNVCHDAADQVFIRSMVELAKAFGMETVAEWVGDAETAEFLTKAGIDYLQGYHYCAPVPPEQLLGPPCA
jgi:diguanylate cyclase (GGDEF)-like protein